MAEKLAAIFPWLDQHILVAFLSALPITELRGAIPFAIFILKMPWHEAFLWSLLGNIIPIPIILLLLDPAQRLISRWSYGDRFFRWLFARSRRKGGKVEKYGVIGLTMFVAVPLPVTGAWTGAAIAYIFGIKFKHALLAIIAGVIIAGTLVTLSCELGLGFSELIRRLINAIW